MACGESHNNTLASAGHQAYNIWLQVVLVTCAKNILLKQGSCLSAPSPQEDWLPVVSQDGSHNSNRMDCYALTPAMRCCWQTVSLQGTGVNLL